MTIHEACRQASSFLEAQGILEAQRQAEQLMGYLLGWDRTEFLLRLREPFPEELREQWERLVRRKAAGEPVQYIIGEQEFYGLSFRVAPGVLIPRPETEILAEAVIEAGGNIWSGTAEPPVLLDAGTGSGAIAVTITVHRPQWKIVASDLSAESLEIARANAERHGVGSRIRWVRGDWLLPFLPGGEHADVPIDILVSNPPYIPSEEVETLQPEVRIYEPRRALDGGTDGLDPYRIMVAQLQRLSRPPKLVGFEVGAGQAREVASMLTNAGWTVRIIPDYAGIERHVLGERSV
jgi:release factor glutamine methyltransferase